MAIDSLEIDLHVWYVYVVDFYCMLRYQPCNCEAELNPWSQAHGRKVSPKCAPGETAAEGRFQNHPKPVGQTWPNNSGQPWHTSTMTSCHHVINVIVISTSSRWSNRRSTQSGQHCFDIQVINRYANDSAFAALRRDRSARALTAPLEQLYTCLIMLFWDWIS